MAEVIWSDPAINDLRGIIGYIDQDDPEAAERIGRRLFALGNSLTDFPNRGRPAAGGTRELVTVTPYILAYQVAEDEVTIIEVRHSRQRLR